MKNKNVNLKAKNYDPYNKECNNTVLLLKNFRTLAGRVASNTVNLKRFIENEYGAKTGEFIDTLKKHNIDINSNEVVRQNLDKLVYENNILTCIEGFIDSLKENHPDGKQIYCVLYYTYLRKYKLNNEAIRNKISYELDKIEVISKQTYVNYLKKAIEELDILIWGDFNPYIDEVLQYVKELNL